MDKVILGVLLAIFGIIFIAFNKKWALWIYEKTQHPSYSLFSFFIVKVDQSKYKNFWVAVNRCGFVFWGAILIIAGFLNLFY